MPRPLTYVAAAVAIAVSLTGCAGSSSTNPQAEGSSPASTGLPSAAGTIASPTAAVRTVNLTVMNGKVTGDIGRADIKLGSTVDVAVTADVAQEVHIHGYDLMVDTIPGQTVHKQFVAKIPGVFEVELEQSKTQLTRLQVQ